ncbi:MAG: sensor histidine kinase [Planctomycetota bacterium]
MSLPEGHHESLIRHSQRMLDLLSGIRREPLRPVAESILRGVATRACSKFAGLLLVRSGHDISNLRITLFAESAAQGIPSFRTKLRNVPFRFLGEETIASLLAGTFVFTAMNEAGYACSRLVSGLLREIQTSSLDMIPILIKGQLKAVLLLSHHGNDEFFDYKDRILFQQISKVMYLSFQSLRQRRRRRQEHRQWKRIADGTCDFAVRIDRHLEVLECIPFRQKFLPGLKGLTLADMTSRSTFDHLSDRICAAIATATPRTAEVRAPDHQHHLRSYSVRVEPSNGRTRHYATLYFTNNEVERAHAEELKLLRSQLDRASRLSLLGQLATEFAHQLTQPLQAVTNKCFTLKSRLRNPEAREEDRLEIMDSIESHINHARDMIFSLRDFLHNRRLILKPVCLKTMMEHAVRMVIPPTENGTCRIDVLDPQRLIDSANKTNVLVDRVHTTHVFLNLLVNSMEACHAAQTDSPAIRISISATPDQRFVLIEIIDNGPGIPLNNPDTVFERFFSTKQEGFGIGLSICRNVIEQQGGLIHVRNNEGPGCCFSFTLPVHTSLQDAETDLVEETWDPESEGLDEAEHR